VTVLGLWQLAKNVNVSKKKCQCIKEMSMYQRIVRRVQKRVALPRLEDAAKLAFHALSVHI
jgi:hypothetical protein